MGKSLIHAGSRQGASRRVRRVDEGCHDGDGRTAGGMEDVKLVKITVIHQRYIGSDELPVTN